MDKASLFGKKIIIYTPELNFKTGGIIALHNLAKDLIENGCNVSLYTIGEKKYKNIFCSKFASLKDVDDNTIVIYPEIVEGNPLNAKHVVRWMLCDIGVHCRKDIYKTWGKDDLVFHFSMFNNKYDPHSIELLYTIWIDPLVKNNNLPRSGSCYLFKKASSFHNNIRLIHPADAILIDNYSNEEIINIFNEKEYFYCYDPYSFYDSMASLCGCIPIVYPMEGINKLDWLKTKSSFQPFLDTRENVSGLAYGLEDVQYAAKTLDKVEIEQREVIEFGKKTVIAFINKIDAYFFNDKKDFKFITVEDAVSIFSWNINEKEHATLLIKQRNIEIGKLNQGIIQKDQEIKQKDQEIQLKDQENQKKIQQKNQEIEMMKSSKFWKLREIYFKLKFFFLSPSKFYKKYRRIFRDILVKFILNIKMEGVGLTFVRSINFLRYGKGVLRKNQLNRGIYKKNSNIYFDKPTYIDNGWPMFSIVSVLYGKEKEVSFFLESFLRQEYFGKFEIIFVDDASTDNSVNTVEDWIENSKKAGLKIPEVRIIHNKENIGNCGSRNNGIREAKGEIIIIIDADCVVNKTFLKNHANAYFCNDCDVAVGPFNLETNGKLPVDVVEYYENNQDEAESDALFQDEINKKSFLNCITRNFSIRKGFIVGDLFDETFSYSKAENSGFGWEDVEMGYRLYKRNVRIKYLRGAFSVHVSHPPTSNMKLLPLKSLKNFRRLFEKHPELLLVSRRWTLDTYEKICKWIKSENIKKNDDIEFLDNRFQKFISNPFALKKGKRLRIVSYRWHCTHQYEIYKLPFDFTLVTGIGTGMADGWDFERRPLPDNVELKHVDDVNLKDYDFAILHFDENVIAPQNTNGVIGYDWGMSFQWFLKNVKIPRVAICHGTPQFYGQYNGNHDGHELMEVIEEERKRLVDALGETMVVVNSFQAQREWMFNKSKVIWHGFDPAEFSQGTHEKNILMMSEKAMSHRPHYNGYIIKNEVFNGIPKEYWYENLTTPSPNAYYENDTNEYASVKFDNYVRELGKYSIYFNPTLRSPMPRTRAEAMMCGVVVVTTKNHDVELFIKNGVNGFYSDKPEELREYILFLLKNPEKARKMGLAGRETAMNIFGNDRFLKDWELMISEIISSK